MPTHGGEIDPRAVAEILGVGADAFHELDLTGTGDSVLVDGRQEWRESDDWWRYGQNVALAAPRTAEEAVNTAVQRMLHDPGDFDAPIGGRGLIAHRDAASGAWGDTQMTRNQALAAIRWGDGRRSSGAPRTVSELDRR